jgi:hypothetical protein
MSEKTSKSIRKAKQELRKEAEKLKSVITHEQKLWFVKTYNESLCKLPFIYRLRHCIKVMKKGYK